MVKKSMFSHFLPFAAVLLGGSMLPVASAEVPLHQAIIQALQNGVELRLPDQAPRPARIQDALLPGESLSTARAAVAELRFDDGSVARVGERSLVRFAAETRTLQLSNGTLLLLVPPERGQTQIQTPNAVASVRGAALFIRYVPETNSTLVGALTDGVEITNDDRSQSQRLGLGQLVLISNNHIEPAYGFDLKTFYETSALAKGLELQPLLTGQRSRPVDGAIEAVRSETANAVQKQTSPCHLNGIQLEDNHTRLSPRETRSTTIVNCSPASTMLTTPSKQPAATLAQPASNDQPATALLTAPTIAIPATIPPTLALPTNIPLINPPTAIATPSVVPTAPSPLEKPPLPTPARPNPTLPEPTLPNPNLPNPNLPNPDLPNPPSNNIVNPPP